jgi:hypothetical protein
MRGARDIRREDGVAMIVAMGIISVMLILTATVVASTQLLGGATKQETSGKRAFEAAEAGLQATVYRLNMLAPATDKCIGGSGETVQAATTGGNCASYSEDLGNGGSFKSWTTVPLSSGGSCAGLQVGTASSISERCVTASGTVDGVTRRVQARVASYAAAPVFPVSGVVGLRSVSISNNGHVNGGTGSNGTVSISNNGSSSSVVIGPSAPAPTVGNNGSSGPVTRRTTAQGPFVLAPVNPGNSTTVNDNVRLSNAFASPRVSPFDSVSTGVTYTAATRTLSLSNNASVTLGGGIYNFCSLSLSNNSTITLAAGARTAIYIDSPERSGSGCPAASGTFSMSNNSGFVNNSPPVAGSGFAHDPTALQLYVVGKTGATVTLANNAAFYGTLYAPTSTVSVANNAGTWGAVAGNDVVVAPNGTLIADPNATSITTSGGGVFFRTAWRECGKTAPATNPSGGC